MKQIHKCHKCGNSWTTGSDGMLYKVRAAFLHIGNNNQEVNTGYSVEMDKEHLHETIGRYTASFGPPLDMANTAEGVTEYEFYRKNDKGSLTVTMVWWPLEKKSNLPITNVPVPVTGNSKPYIPPSPLHKPVEEVTPNKQMEDLISSGYLTKTY